jgi:hypothetical protein
MRCPKPKIKKAKGYDLGRKTRLLEDFARKDKVRGDIHKKVDPINLSKRIMPAFSSLSADRVGRQGG